MLFADSEIRAIWYDYLSYNEWEKLFELGEIYPDVRSLYIDFESLVEYNGDFAYDILDNPEIYLKIAKSVLSELVPEASKANIRITNISDLAFRKINDINSSDVGKMIKIDGIVRKVSDARPIITVGAWICSDCGCTTFVATEDGKLKKPDKCACCGKSKYKVSFKLDPKQSEKVDFRYLEIQDIPENIQGTSQPRKLEVHLYDDIALEKINPGDRLEITGILKAVPMGSRNNPSAQMSFYLEANSIIKKNKDWSSIKISGDDEEKIKALSRSPELMEMFKQSIAPSIWGYDIIKEALVLQMFGGVPKKLPNGGRKRGDIHILLVGDPGTAKSEILMQVANIAPRAIYTSGKGTSAAGLTAAAVKDKNNVWTLEAGALVIADKGMVCIDEIDKMSNEDRGAIHTAMEQQIVAIDKAGIHITLPSRCSILAAANPVHGRFDTTYSLSSQINLDPALLTRFDAIFKIVDRPDVNVDTALARHLIDIHHAGESEEKDKFAPSIDVELLRKYIVYAKMIKPVMSDDTRKFLQEVYVKMRNKYSETGAIAVTPRQLEAMIRFAEASARFRLSNVVTVEDAKRAVRIVEYYLRDVAMDTVSGIIDIDSLYGLSTKARKLAEEIYEYVYSEESVLLKEIYMRFSEYSPVEIEQAINHLKSLGKIKISGNYVYSS